MASLNKVMLIGNLGRDPEIRHTQAGSAVVILSVATNERWDTTEGEKAGRTEWHRVITFGKLAEICGEHLAKGRTVYIERRLQTRPGRRTATRGPLRRSSPAPCSSSAATERGPPPRAASRPPSRTTTSPSSTNDRGLPAGWRRGAFSGLRPRFRGGLSSGIVAVLRLFPPLAPALCP